MLITGVCVTVVYLLLGLCITRVYGLGSSSDILTREYTSLFTFIVPVAIVATNVLIVSLGFPTKFLSMAFLYMNTFPIIMLLYYVVNFFRLTQSRNRQRREENVLYGQIQIWMSTVYAQTSCVKLKPYVYLSHGKLHGKIVALYKDENDFQVLKNLEQKLPNDVIMNFVKR